MSIEEKVGQVFIWTVGGTALTPQTAEWLAKYQPGAIIAFSRNIDNTKQVAKLNSDLQELAYRRFKTPLFLMIDQEGGTVTRVKSAMPLPSALAVGKLGDAKLARSFGKAKAEFLSKLGFNVNLSPVLDLSDSKKDTFIGNRAFGEDPNEVSHVAIAYAEGLSQGGMLPTAKHFPGHGGISQDSHFTEARKLGTFDELITKDLKPFENYADQPFVKALMTAHLALPDVDPSGLPATYSQVLIREYLRGKLGYQGLIFTDDLEMNGAAGEPIGERAVKAFLAGNDMLMLAGSAAHQREAHRALLAAVKDGRISVERLDESVDRILEAKALMKAGRLRAKPAAVAQASRTLTGLSREILHRNFTLALESADLPQVAESAEVLVLSSDQRFFKNFSSKFRGKSTFFKLSPESLASAQAQMALPRFQIAVYYASGSKTAHGLKNMETSVLGKTVVVNANHAGEIAAPEKLRSVLNVNSASPESGAWLAEALQTLPVRLPANAK